MKLGNTFSYLLTAAMLAGCSTLAPSAGTCPVDMTLLQALILPVRPTELATNDDLLNYALDLKEQVRVDAVRKAALREQLEKCR